jgi:DNA mismatch endonuclease (patch repair protein)
VQKIVANQARDAKKAAELTLQGWRVLVVWECETKGLRLDETLERLNREIKA